jgi:hypothetical protein
VTILLTLPRFFVLAIALLAALAALVLSLAVRTAGAAVLRAGETSRDLVAGRVAGAVEADLGVAERADWDGTWVAKSK